MNNQKLKTVYTLFSDCWKLFKRFIDAESDEQWQECTEEAARIVERYGEGTRPLVLDTLELLENTKKEMQNEKVQQFRPSVRKEGA